MRRLRIALLGSDFIRIPPRPRDVPAGSSGAPEQIVFKITEAMVKRGHRVTLFASGNSKTSANLFYLQKTSTGVNPKIGRERHIDFEYALMASCIQKGNRGEFDIIHSHFDDRSAILANFSKIPLVSTLHSPLIENKRKILRQFSQTQYYVSISNAQRNGLPGLNYIKTIYHGININNFPFSAQSKGYYIFIGRMRPEKGVHRAIAIAKKMRKKLFLFGSHDNENMYWKKCIFPHIDQKQIVYMGHVAQKKLYSFLRYAEALLFPIAWNEPFGLVIIEAMACGTPVIGFAHGSVPEIIQSGKTGFVVRNESQAIQSLKNIATIKRQECRLWVEKKFTEDRMMDEYEKVYYKIVDRSQR